MELDFLLRLAQLVLAALRISDWLRRRRNRAADSAAVRRSLMPYLASNLCPSGVEGFGAPFFSEQEGCRVSPSRHPPDE